MAILEYEPKAYGAPGIPPRWTRSAKDIVGTAYSTSSRIWFTASAGVLNEIYYPDHRSAAGPRPAVPGQRRRKLFPR